MQKAKQIVATALYLDKEERSIFINKKCAGDSDLKYQVTELIKVIEQSDTEDIFEEIEATPSYQSDDLPDDTETYASSLIGAIIGRYKILDLIGHGGMGSVFLAERADNTYAKKVALKILRRGMDTPSNIARFKRERNILAKLDHPNIARLYDGGVSDNGLPYLVMEYVPGVPLLEYCDIQNLTIEKRLELFKSVCKAVQNAHRNAIIHRDLKPSNIYVTANGTVKVLDFGIAKILKSEASEENLFQTDPGTKILTLGYAAPEQVENKAITTATDSYTLGIVLFELLSGSHPFDLGKKEFLEIEKLICDHTPNRPSQKFCSLPESKKTTITSRRNTTSSELAQNLAGNLDTIVMKALRKKPEDRYPSVEQMLEDLNRYEHSLPLIAQSNTFRYRVGKFLKRNCNAVVSGFLIITTIIGFWTYHINRIAEERKIAEMEAQKVETVKNFLIDIFRPSDHQSTSFGSKDISVEKLLLMGQKKINNEFNNQPDVYTEIILAIGSALKSIGAFEEAERSYKKALAKSAATTKPIENKLRSHIKLGWLYTDWRESQKQAHQHAIYAKKLLRKIKNPSPTLEASVFSLLGRVLSVRDQRKLGNSYFEKADSIYVNAGLEHTYDYIKMLTGYGRALIYVSEFKKSEEVLLKSNRLHRQKYDNPTLTIAENHKFMAWANRELGNFERSNHYFKKSTALKRELIGEQKVKTAISMYHLARNYTLSGDFEKSEQLAKKVLQIYQKALEPSNDYIQYAKRYLAIAKSNQNKLAAAEKLFQEVIKSFSKKYGRDHISFANTAARLAVVYQKTGRYDKAISLLKKCIQINTTELGERSRGVGIDMLKLADVYRAKGNYEIAQTYFQQVRSIFKDVIPDNHYRRAEFYFKFAKLKQEIDKSQQAQKYFQKAYEIYLDNFGEDSQRTKNVKTYLEKLSKA